MARRRSRDGVRKSGRAQLRTHAKPRFLDGNPSRRFAKAFRAPGLFPRAPPDEFPLNGPIQESGWCHPSQSAPTPMLHERAPMGWHPEGLLPEPARLRLLPEFPSATATFRTNPSRVARQIGLFLNRFLNSSGEMRTNGERSGMRIPFPGAKSLLGCLYRKSIPGAGFLAIITTEDSVSHQRAKWTRDRAAQFNGQIRNAKSRVKDVGSHDSSGRAGIHTTAACAAEIFRPGIPFKLDIQQNYADKKPGSAVRVIRFVFFPIHPSAVRAPQAFSMMGPVSA